MAFTRVGSYSSNFANGFTNSPSIASVVANASDAILLCCIKRDANALTGLTWNSQSLTQIGTDLAQGENTMSVYGLSVTTGGTATLSGTFADFTRASWYVIVVRPPSGTPSFSALSTQIHNSGTTYATPSITIGSVPAGAVLIDFFAGLGWDSSYNDVSATTWTSVTSTSDGSVTNTSSLALTNLYCSYNLSGSGSVTSGWTPSANQPMFGHIALYVTAGAVATVNTLSSPLTVGGTGYSGTTSNMGTVTSITNGTITGTGSGTFNFNMNSFQNGVVYLNVGTPTFTVSDGTNSPSKSSTLNTLSGYTAVTLSGTIDTGAYSLGKDAAFIAGNVVHLPTAAGTLNANGTLTDYVFGSYSGWMWEQSTGKMWSFTLTVTNSGASTTSSFGVARYGVASYGTVSYGVKN